MTACAVVWLRRRRPVAVTIVLSALLCVKPSAAGAGLVALFTFATHRPARVVVILLVPGLACWTFGVYLRPGPRPAPRRIWHHRGTGDVRRHRLGMFARSRQQLMQVMRERAQQAAAQAKLREERRPAAGAEDVAREMHDVPGQALQDLRDVIGVLRAPHAPDASPPVAGTGTTAMSSKSHTRRARA